MVTGHGEVSTPLFLPVATKGTVKTLEWGDVRALGARAVICNALLLGLRPGEDVLRSRGGVHGFTGWDGAYFSDSGGFQVLKEELLHSIGDDGIRFKNPYTGERLTFMPEDCARAQQAVSPDVAMVLDDCPRHDASEKRIKMAVHHTIDWAGRFKVTKARPNCAIFAITQGGRDRNLRRKCADALLKIGFDGYAVGGLSIGEPRDEMMATLDWHLPQLPAERPRYLMGVGSPLELLDAVGLGADVFDSAFPTRNARHRQVYTRCGCYDVGKSRFQNDERPLEEDCECPACSSHSRAYVHHLLRENELTGLRLASMHNLNFTLRLMRDARLAILEGEFERFRRDFERDYVAGCK